MEAESPMLQKVVEKILGSWEVVEQRRKLFSSKAFADFYKQLQQQNASKKMQGESKESKISPKLKRDKLELRSKKSRSLQLETKKSVYIDRFEIKSSIKVKMAQEFNRRNFNLPLLNQAKLPRVSEQFK